MDISAYLAPTLNLDKICRACLIEKSDMKPLYGAHLSEMINSVTSIQAKYGDGLPSLLCVQCVMQCSRAHTFKELCERSDRRLREFHKPAFQEPVTLIDAKIEVDERSELDQYAEVAFGVVKEEIEPEFVTCTDSAAVAEQRTDSLEMRLTPPPASKKYKCAQCDLTFDTKSILSKHKQEHTRKLGYIYGKPHRCSVCGRAFNLATTLKTHMNHHIGHNLLDCKYCDKQYVEVGSLKIHILEKHSSDRPYTCNICSRTFTHHSYWRTHMRSHAGGTSHICEICGKSCKNSSNLTKHIKTHDEFKSYVCDVCGEKLVGVVRLEMHMKCHLEVKEGAGLANEDLE